ncbi:hypothetical protein NRO40_18795 [Streptomyces changanensis]|uniref:Lipoprotein n=2 Tax=Streptomyces TaxID=1883 RepID=A0ABY5N9H0_9ACTN|nr:hypothetical protein [Streptomyces changanensis]UUS32660.1 hypothetical protein NRO40_18795 [Streptomyces changanensis]
MLAGAAALAAVAALTAGCGIRTTSVPVDAGGAPSRVPCSLSEAATGSRTPDGGTTARVYLVCASGLEPVDRTLPPSDAATGEAGRVAVARALVEAMRERPSQDERQAGFTTYVEEPLTVSAGREGDPEGALRLSRQPEDLPPAALAQIVCTYAGADATSVGGTVVLGGPGKYPVRRYVCDEGVKERPESAVPTRSP